MTPRPRPAAAAYSPCIHLWGQALSTVASALDEGLLVDNVTVKLLVRALVGGGHLDEACDLAWLKRGLLTRAERLACLDLVCDHAAGVILADHSPGLSLWLRTSLGLLLYLLASHSNPGAVLAWCFPHSHHVPRAPGVAVHGASLVEPLHRRAVSLARLAPVLVTSRLPALPLLASRTQAGASPASILMALPDHPRRSGRQRCCSRRSGGYVRAAVAPHPSLCRLSSAGVSEGEPYPHVDSVIFFTMRKQPAWEDGSSRVPCAAA